MKWEKALKYSRNHKRMIAVMMAGVIGFACFYSADASVIKDAKKKKNEAQQNLDNINQQINNIQSEQSKVKSQMAAYDEQLMWRELGDYVRNLQRKESQKKEN